MKKIMNFKYLSFLLLIAIAFSSCVQDDDFTIPPINSKEPNITVNSSIQLVKDTYRGFEPLEVAPNASQPVYIEGYVVSSDEFGNFFKTLIIQDKSENPTAGIAISTERTDVYTFFEPGRKVYFRVDGLFSGKFANLPTLGTQNGADVGRISVEEFDDRIVRSLQVDTLVPTIVSISEALTNNALLNTFIQIQDVQFPDDELGKPYGNSNNTFSVNRTVQNCDDQEITLRNSGFSDFKDFILPSGKGTIDAVLGIFNTTKQIFIRNPRDVNFTGERCI